MDIMSLAATLTLDSSSFETKLKKSESTFSKFGDSLKKGISKATKAAGAAMAAAGAATTAFIVSSVKEGKAFDVAMSNVAATMGKSVAEVGKLRDFARQMGATTAFSATQAAEALNYMALAGYDAEKSMQMLPKVLDLAAAGDIDLAAASDMVTDAASALGLSISETDKLVDQMAKTSSKSNTSVAQLGEAILSVGGTAKVMKGGTTELNSVLGVLADNGIKGSEGGRALRNVLLSLSAPTDKAAKVIKKLGVEVFDSEGNMRELPNILTDMNAAMDGMTDEEKTSILSEIFNRNDMKSVNALLGTSVDRWAELYKEIDRSKGAASDMAKTKLDNLEGDVTKFKSALSEAKIIISDALTPSLRGFVQEGTTLLTKITDGFKEGGVAGAINAADKGLREFFDNLKASDDPVLQTVGSSLEWISGLFSFIVDLVNDWDGTIDKLKSSENPFEMGLGYGLELLKTAFETVFGLITDWDGTVEKLRTSDDFGLHLIGDALDAIKKALNWIKNNQEAAKTALSVIMGVIIGKKVDASVTKLLTFLSGSKIAGLATAGGSAGTSWGAAFAGKAIKALGPLAAFLAVLGYTTSTRDKLGNNDLTDEEGNLTKEAEAYGFKQDENGNISDNQGYNYDREGNVTGYNPQELRFNPDTGRFEYMDDTRPQISRDQRSALDNFWNTYKEDPMSDNVDAAMENLQKAFEGQDELFERVNSIIDDFITANNENGLPENLPENLFKVMPAMDDSAQSVLQEQLSGLNLSVAVRPRIIGETYYPHAKGLWNVPEDNYPALLHRGERVLTASQARKQDGEGMASNAFVEALQSLRQDMQNLRIVVGRKTFGRAVVSYGGDRVDGYLGESENRFYAGYGT